MIDENDNRNLLDDAELEEAVPEGAVNDDNNNNNPDVVQNVGDAVVANVANNNANNDDVNWNPIEWDRAEELTWERLLGLDGLHFFCFNFF